MKQLKMKPDVARKWVDALRSGKYTQGTGRLATVTETGVQHCCLGVLCEIAVDDGVIPKPVLVDTPVYPTQLGFGKNDAGYDSVAVPPDIVVEWAFEDADHYDPTSDTLWTAVDKAGKFEGVTLHDVPGSVHLPEANDHGGADFNDIADMIEATHLATVPA